MSKLDKGTVQTWFPAIVGVIIVILIGGGILAFQYWWLPRQEIEMPEIEIPEKKTPEEVEVPADWKTYRNEEYGFEIRYPGDSANFDSIDYTNPDDLIKHNIPPEYPAGNLLLVVSFRFEDTSDTTRPYGLLCASYEIKIEKVDYSDINNWVEDLRQRIETPSEYEGIMISGKLSSVEDIEIQDKTAKRITIEGGFPFWTAQFGVINNGKLYTINYLDMSSSEDRSGCFERNVEQGEAKYKDIFGKLLSTFRFLE